MLWQGLLPHYMLHRKVCHSDTGEQDLHKLHLSKDNKSFNDFPNYQIFDLERRHLPHF